MQCTMQGEEIFATPTQHQPQPYVRSSIHLLGLCRLSARRKAHSVCFPRRAIMRVIIHTCIRRKNHDLVRPTRDSSSHRPGYTKTVLELILIERSGGKKKKKSDLHKSEKLYSGLCRPARNSTNARREARQGSNMPRLRIISRSSLFAT